MLYDAWGYAAPFLASATMASIALVAAIVVVPETRTREVQRREKLRRRRMDDTTRVAGTGAQAANTADAGPVTGTTASKRWTAFLDGLPRPLHVFGILLCFRQFEAGIIYPNDKIALSGFKISNIILSTIVINDLVPGL